MRRALETCHNIFNQNKNNYKDMKIIVDPLFTENLSSNCDLGTKIKESMELFSNFDFSEVKKIKDIHLWNLE